METANGWITRMFIWCYQSKRVFWIWKKNLFLTMKCAWMELRITVVSEAWWWFAEENPIRQSGRLTWNDLVGLRRSWGREFAAKKWRHSHIVICVTYTHKWHKQSSATRSGGTWHELEHHAHARLEDSQITGRDIALATDQLNGQAAQNGDISPVFCSLFDWFWFLCFVFVFFFVICFFVFFLIFFYFIFPLQIQFIVNYNK